MQIDVQKKVPKLHNTYNLAPRNIAEKTNFKTKEYRRKN